MENNELKEAVLEAQVEAFFEGHQLGVFEEVENGYQAKCIYCQATTWVGRNGLRYSLLEDVCPSRKSIKPNS